MDGVLKLAPPYSLTIFEQTDIVGTVESAPLALGALPIRLGVQFNVDSSTSGVGEFVDGDVAVASGVLTFGTPNNDSTVVVTGPTGGPYTFTKVAAAPGADEFTDITELEALIEAIPGLNASEDSTDITITVASVGADANSWTITGTDSYSALNITFSGGVGSDVNDDDHEITIADHGYSTGLKVNYDVVSGTTLDNLVDNTDYFVIKIDDDTIQLATTLENAEAGTEIEIAAADNAVGGGSFTLTPATVDVDVDIFGTNDNVEALAEADIHWINMDSHDAMTGAASYLYSNATPCFAYMKVSLAPQGGSEFDAEVIVHTKL